MQPPEGGGEEGCEGDERATSYSAIICLSKWTGLNCGEFVVIEKQYLPLRVESARPDKEIITPRCSMRKKRFRGELNCVTDFHINGKFGNNNNNK